MTSTNTLAAIRTVFLDAQDVCGEIIRASGHEAPIIRVGFLSADVCLAIAEDGQRFPGDVAGALANVFHSLSKSRPEHDEAHSPRFMAAMLACERAALDLADHGHGLSTFTSSIARFSEISPGDET